MSKWPTMFDAYFTPEEVSSAPGTEMRMEYALSVGKDGRKCLKAVREYNVRDHIQSYAPGCDMSVILNKLRAGLICPDFDETNCVDLSLMPKDVVEALHNLSQFKSTFAQMPEAVQKMFDYNPSMFVDAFVSGQLPEMLQSLSEPPADPPAEPPADPPKE